MSRIEPINSIKLDPGASDFDTKEKALIAFAREANKDL